MNTKQKIAVFDIDGTIFRKNLHFELINELVWMKVFPRYVRKKLIDLYTDWLEHKGTYESYRMELVKLYNQHIKGKKPQEIKRASQIVVPFHKNRTYIYADSLINKLRKKNYHIIAISGSPIEIVEEFNKLHMGLDKVFGTVYETDKQGFYTGKEKFTPVKNKGFLLKQYIIEHNLTLENSFGIGDTESDLSFLELVSHPIAFNPNFNLKQIAEKKGWTIKVEKKDVIYDVTCKIK